MHANYSDKKMQRRTNIMKDSGIIPIWERYLMTVIEASEYYHIGENKLRNIIETHPNTDFLIMNGNRYLIKKKLFEDFLRQSSVL